jgi:PAS domain-containing protein
MNETTTAIPASHPPGAESRFRTLFDQAPVGMVLIDPASGGLLEANQRLATILGLSPAAMATLDWQVPRPTRLMGITDGEPPGKAAGGRWMTTRGRSGISVPMAR